MDAPGVGRLPQQYKIVNKDVDIFKGLSGGREGRIAGVGDVHCHITCRGQGLDGALWHRDIHSHLVKEVVWATQSLVGEVGDCFCHCGEGRGAVLPVHGQYNGVRQPWARSRA